MWEIFEVKNKEEAKMLIAALETHKNSDLDMRNEYNPEKLEDNKLIDELIERLS